VLAQALLGDARSFNRAAPLRVVIAVDQKRRVLDSQRRTPSRESDVDVAGLTAWAGKISSAAYLSIETDRLVELDAGHTLWP